MSKLKIAIIQSLIGGGGGNDMVFDSVVNHISKSHDVTVFTFSKPLKDTNYKCKTILPIRIPLFGIYQNLFIKIKNLDKYDVIISLSSIFINTKKPLIFYNQNLFYDKTQRPEKYRSLFWRIYYMPYDLIMRVKLSSLRAMPNLFVLNSSHFAKQNLDKILNTNSTVLYPPVKLEQTKIQPKENTIVSLGRFSEEKNFELGIKIINNLGYKYKILGSTNTITSLAYLKKLKEISKNNIEFIINPTRETILYELSKAKIILGLSNETFGIAIVEGISSGCIPLVPNTSGNIETVPTIQLRFENTNDMSEKLKLAMDGQYDLYLNDLQQHIKKFDEKHFHDNLDGIISMVTK